jgi:hypothetical protein
MSDRQVRPDNANAFEFLGMTGRHWALDRWCARWRFRETVRQDLQLSSAN